MRPPPGYYEAEDADLVAPVRKRAKPRAIEAGIQVAIVRYLRLQLPGAAIHASPNGAHIAGTETQKAIQIAKLKAAGMMIGWPDLEVIYKGHSWFFEVKQRRGVVKPEQIEVGRMLEANGARWAVVRSVEDVAACVREWRGEA